MEKKRVRLREVQPLDDDGDDEGTLAPSRTPPQRPPSGVKGAVPPPPGFGPPAPPPRLPARAPKAAFEEAGPPPSQAPRKGPRSRAKGRRQRAKPLLAKTKAAGLESDDSSEEEKPKAAPAQAPAAPQEDSGGFLSTLWKGATAAMGVVSDIVTAINAESDSEEDKPAESAAGGAEQPKDKAAASTSLPPKKESSAKTKAEEEEQYVEYVSQFCVYLGIDVAGEPDLITEVDDYLKKPLPFGWTTHQTGEDCEYGAGYTYFMQSSTGRTQWTRPDEDEFLQRLRGIMKRPPAAGSRLFFAALRDRNRKERWAALEDQIDHLTGARPLLRALPEGSAEPTTAASLESCIFHVVLHKRFPVLHPAVTEAFASYFGLGALTQYSAAELRHFWIAKLAALCPVPNGWEFKFDETSMSAVFVDQEAGTASRHHPMDAFFAGLLERLLSRHRSIEAAESRAGQAGLSGQIVFFLDSRNGSPYWLQYGQGVPWTGTLPWRERLLQAAARPAPAGPSQGAPPEAPSHEGLRDAARATPAVSLRQTASQE
ncbi:unnamed protein product, partial [Effrenium voratum]